MLYLCIRRWSCFCLGFFFFFFILFNTRTKANVKYVPDKNVKTFIQKKQCVTYMLSGAIFFCSSDDQKSQTKRKHKQANKSVSVSVSVSAQDGIVALGKARTRSAPSLSSLPKAALETVPIFAWLNTDRSRPWKVECRPLPFSTPLSFRRSVL